MKYVLQKSCSRQELALSWDKPQLAAVVDAIVVAVAVAVAVVIVVIVAAAFCECFVADSLVDEAWSFFPTFFKYR